MNHNITVNTDTLKKDSQDITTKAENLRASLEEVYNEVKALDTMWDGPANTAFNLQFAKDYENFKKVCTTIENFAQDMNNAASEYERCESEIQSVIKALKV